MDGDQTMLEFVAGDGPASNLAVPVDHHDPIILHLILAWLMGDDVSKPSADLGPEPEGENL